MIKKSLAYSFLFLANMVLLAHAVIPHHHHNQQVCIETKHCVDNEADRTNNTHSQDHGHDGNTNPTKCVLLQEFVIPSSKFRIFQDFDIFNGIHHHDFYILSDIGYLDLQPISDVATSIPNFPSILTSSKTLTPALRAPPVV